MSKTLSNLDLIEESLEADKKGQLKNVDTFLSPKISICMPITGPSEHAISSFHKHPSYFFVLTFDEEVSFQMKDRKIITKKGMITALSPNISHYEIFNGKFIRYIAIFIEKEFFEEQLGQYPIEKDIYYNGDYITLPQGFLDTVKEFMIEADNDLPGSDSVIYSISLKICHSLIRSTLKLSYKQDRITYRMEVDKIIEYMYSNMDKKLSIESLAKVVNISPSYCTRIFKNETGESIMNYLNNIRLEQVKRLLLKGEKSITEIALECGFNSSAYLSSSFYKKYNMSPSNYQNLIKEDNISKI
ncbi:MAG: helix-turn-helix transcriptional regulator [Clostridium sp.]|uniref:helix-turn-helix transcriptional regulator n=1 Tax=Clostridium sp. TaxID=1506 RepID=UPI0025C02501|nr:helix-turn-helix transcriptional regulator [Clostridium sp.]MCF0148149.1 helix-turn-helix transcriptional regulator [Clostridium sp.]